jgi:hypothetical protein
MAGHANGDRLSVETIAVPLRQIIRITRANERIPGRRHSTRWWKSRSSSDDSRETMDDGAIVSRHLPSSGAPATNVRRAVRASAARACGGTVLSTTAFVRKIEPVQAPCTACCCGIRDCRSVPAGCSRGQLSSGKERGQGNIVHRGIMSTRAAARQTAATTRR